MAEGLELFFGNELLLIIIFYYVIMKIRFLKTNNQIIYVFSR